MPSSIEYARDSREDRPGGPSVASSIYSALARSIPPADLAEHGVAIIPEVAGATVRLEHAAASYIDARQGAVFRHGLIYRSAAFVEDFPGLEIYPAFALLSERDGALPPIVAWWREAGGGTAVSFEAFLDETIVAPVVRAAAYLVFAQAG